MKVLITGGTGMLGKALVEGCPDGTEILATYFGKYSVPDQDKVSYVNMDVQDEAAYKKIFDSFRPDVVIHAASIGSPDFAEQNKEITWSINVEGTQKVLSLCESSGAKFIYISSNGIYDGDKAPYGEDDKAEPINYYGMTKLEGEILTRRSKVTSAIVRPILMYGWNHPFERNNIVTTALLKLAKNEKMNVYDDVYSNPLYSVSCADAIWKIIEDGKYEAFNIAGKDSVSIYELLRRAASVFGLDASLLNPVQQGFFNELVRRPKDTSYRTDKMKEILHIEPLSLDEGLQQMKNAGK